MIGRFLCVSLLIAFGLQVTAQDALKSEPTFEQVLQGIVKAEQVVKTLSVEMQAKRMSDMSWLVPNADRNRSVFSEN